MIHINQLGYRPNDKKMAVFTENVKSFIVTDSKGTGFLNGRTTDKKFDAVSGDFLSYGDFSGLKELGEYYIVADNGERSFPIYIKNNPYAELHQALLKMFFYQRCGLDLSADYAGDFAHNACHLTPAVIYGTEETKDVSGGWHDAGDYGKYITAAAAAVADLLLAFEAVPLFSDFKIDIPHSDTGLPHILEEIKHELLWMLKMQDEVSGGVYHKVTTYRFAVQIMPDEDNLPQVICPLSSTATADFAACMALAARILQTYDKAFADKCKAAATKAWTWLMKNPKLVGNFFPAGVLTGAYNDKDDRDERYWAAAELYKLTGEDEFHAYLKENDCAITALGVYNVGFFAVLSYLALPAHMTHPALYEKLKNALTDFAEVRTHIAEQDGYHISLTEKEYSWGCHINIGHFAILLHYASEYFENNTIKQIVLDHLHYLLGVNAVGKCFVTGFGSNPVIHPHHRPSQVIGYATPGMVAGGPDYKHRDEYAKVALDGMPPAKSYIDAYNSFSTNEITIYWNSPFVWLLGLL